ncbi:MAG: polyprenyl synthetase family protein [Spirochaetaceae bacterium]|jgi:heptaprenyl diphosphate synthase|nr:polyprenyl synthetase family protein [Spirochaetaceae bacterium]
MASFDKNKIEGLKDDLKLVDVYVDEYLRDESGHTTLRSVLSTISATGGKKVRPLVLLLSGRLGPKWPACRDRLCKMGAAVELIHTASLIHDDIVDDSPMRRRKRTVQSKFGKEMAVYAGDFVLSRIVYYLFKEASIEAGMLLAKTVESMCCGEIGQYAGSYDTEAPIKDYLSNIFGKTASLFVAACAIGAMESGCDKKTSMILRQVGEHIGYLFQLRDDLLNVTSSTSSEGKPVHSDFINGIYTMPILHALHHPGGGRLRELLHTIGPGAEVSYNIEEIEKEVEDILNSSRGIEFTRETIRAHARQAEELLETLPKGPVPQGFLEILELLSAGS